MATQGRFFTMDVYDPHIAPDPEEWNAADEQECIQLIVQYHEEEGIELPNSVVHATLHTLIENQAALGSETPVAAAIERLMGEGLDRHDAIHALGSVFMEVYFPVMRGDTSVPPDELTARYFEAIRTQTAERWRTEYSE
jgi:hypothetical protein